MVYLLGRQNADVGRVYFATMPTRPGQIKIGTSTQLARRLALGGFLLLADIPGSQQREAALHWLFRPLRLDGEWFASAPSLWRAVLSAMDAGDLDWLRNEKAMWPPTDKPKRVRLVSAYCGDRVAASRRLECAAITGPSLESGLWARFCMEQDRDAGLLPDWLPTPQRDRDAA
jgi:hypothetical protein